MTGIKSKPCWDRKFLIGLLTLFEINDRTYISFVLFNKLYVTNQLCIFGLFPCMHTTMYHIYDNVPNRDRSL